MRLASWGSGGDGAGQFWLPSGVAVDDLGKVYVADRGNHRIQVLSTTGQPLAWQKHGVGEENKGTLSTAGGLMFTGQADGNMKAYDAKPGNDLWSFQVGWGIGDTLALPGNLYDTVMTDDFFFTPRRL